jgi:hypothetical protein
MQQERGGGTLDDWLTGVTEAISALPMHQTVRDQLWVVPTFQTIHILCVGIVFSASLIIALRALGLAGKHWSLARWQQRFAGWTAVSLLMLLFSGGVLTLAEPDRELLNSLFQIKMPLVVAATLLSFGLGRQFAFASAHRPVAVGAKLGAICVLLLWSVIMILGRWIAYAG